MNSFKHVFFTWLLIQLLYPLIYFSSVLLCGDMESAFNFPVLWLSTPVFSLPALLAAWVAFLVLMEFDLPVPLRFFAWLMIIFSFILISFWLIPFTSEMSDQKGREFLYPLLFTAFTAAVLRYHHFATFDPNQLPGY